MKYWTVKSRLAVEKDEDGEAIINQAKSLRIDTNSYIWGTIIGIGLGNGIVNE